MKYIIVETEDVENSVIMFDDFIAHDEMAAGVPHLTKVKSAGFIEVLKKDNIVDIRCYGRSVSLNIDSNPELDTHLVKSCLMRNFKCFDKRKSKDWIYEKE